MTSDRGTGACAWDALRGAAVLALVAFVAGCSSASWRSLELGDVLGVRGRHLDVSGQGLLEGSVDWAIAITVEPQRFVPVARARFGVGTAARWTLTQARPTGGAWPEALTVSRAAWAVELTSAGRAGRYEFELEAGQTLTRIEPCDPTSCSYAFTDGDAHRDVFAFEVVAGRDPSLDSWLNEIERGIEGQVSLMLDASIIAHGDPPSAAVVAIIPLTPSGATLEFRP